MNRPAVMDEAQRSGTLADVPRLVWAWVVLQAVALTVELFRPDAASAKLALFVITMIVTVYFVRGRRWAWWLAVVSTSLGLAWEVVLLILGSEDRSPALVASVVGTSILGLVLLLTPSVRGHFRRWGRPSRSIPEAV